ncbi:MAG: SCO2521 family protein [Micromonosporaceae bacterium]
MFVLGEVHTGLLQHSHALPDRDVARLLSLVAGERVRQSSRPISFSMSPEILSGLDCDMTTASGSAVRVVGTAVCRAAVLGGHILQGSSFTWLSERWDQQRQPWAHYLAQPGVLQAIGKTETSLLASGYLEAGPTASRLDLGAISGRTVDTVQRTDMLDRQAPFRVVRTRLRWTARLYDDENAAASSVEFTLVGPQSRTLTLAYPGSDVRHAVQLCEAAAFHDWLLTTVITLVERARIGGASRPEVVDRLQPVIDYLAHLWMPTARLPPCVAQLWRRLEQRPGFSRQWHNLITRVRDQLTLASLAASCGTGRDRPGL